MSLPWTQEEIQVLSELCKRHVPLDEIARALPVRSKEAIRLKLQKLGLHVYTKAQPDMKVYHELVKLYKG